MLINTLQGVAKLCCSLERVIKRGFSFRHPLQRSEAQSERTKQTDKTLRTWFNTISDSDLIKPQYIVFIQSSFNNTLLSLSNSKGDILAWASAGSVGFRKSRRSSNVAAQATGEVLARKALEIGIQSVDIHMNGLGFTKESALRGLHSGGLRFTHLRDITSMPHNGCRPPKKRRV